MSKNRFAARVLVVFITIVGILFFGCGKQEETSSDRADGTSPVSVANVESQDLGGRASSEGTPRGQDVGDVLFRGRLVPALVEEQVNALPLWREYKENNPTLVVFSGKAIQPVPPRLRDEVDRLLAEGDAQELQRRIARPVPDLLLNADMGIAAAMTAGFFSKVVWVVPVEEGSVLSLLDFRERLHQRAAGWGSQIDSFTTSKERPIVGTLAGTPVEVVTLEQLPDLAGLLLVHIDSAFFNTYYRNEVKTPLYPTLAKIFGKIAARGYRVASVSISRDNLSYESPLTMRFLGRDVATFVAEPERLKDVSRRMMIRSEMFYLDSFYQPETILAKARELVELDPEDPAGHYSLYRALRQDGRLDNGLEALEVAIRLDPVYADEYIELIRHAEDKGLIEPALQMIDNVIRAVPGNVLARLRKAQLLTKTDGRREAEKILLELAELPWSDIYYPRIRRDIGALLELARNDIKAQGGP